MYIYICIYILKIRSIISMARFRQLNRFRLGLLAYCWWIIAPSSRLVTSNKGCFWNVSHLLLLRGLREKLHRLKHGKKTETTEAIRKPTSWKFLEYHDILRHFGIISWNLWSQNAWAEILAFRKWPASEMQGVKPTNPSSTSSIKLYDP